MALSINQDSKNSLSITNENKPSALIWNDASWSWDEAGGSWEQPEEVLAKSAKNSLTINNESKS